MLALIGLAAAAIAAGAVFLPIWSFIRVTRLTGDVARLAARIDALERMLRQADRGRADPATSGAGAPSSPPAAAGVMTPPAPEPMPLLAPPVARTTAAAAVVTDAASPRLDKTAGPTAPPSSVADDDLESRVGGRWLLYVGVVILLIGVSFFLKYAFDNEWITEGGRVIVGAIGGLTLVIVGRRMSAHLETFGRALSGTGLAVLYLSIYAALQFYGLIAPWTAFAAMTGTTLLATWMADRSDAQSLALIAAAGGFLTPLLVSGTTHDTVLLLSYILLLNVGVGLLNRRHEWSALPAVSYVLTLFTLGVWADDSYARSEWATVLAFLTALAVVFADMLRHVLPRPGVQARFATALLATGPLVYHVSALAITADHPPAIHIYLIVFTAVGLLATPGPDRAWLRPVLLIVVYVPVFAFIRETTLGQSWFVATLVTTSAIAVMHLIALIDRVVRQETSLGTADCLVLHAAVIGLFGVSAEMLSPRYPEWRGGAAALLALGSSALWFFFERRDRVGALNAAGLSFTLVALAIAVQFEGRVVEIGWAVEGAVAAWVGLRSGSRVFGVGGLVLWLLALGRLTDGYFAGPGETTTILNDRSLATLVVVALAYLIAWAWRRHQPDHRFRAAVPVALHVAASAMTLLWISAEIDVYWADRSGTRQAELTEELMRSLAWGLYGAALIVIGLWRALASLRWIGIGAIGLTVLKVFFVDLSRLGGIYRVIGFLVVGVLLVGISYLYQQSRIRDRRARTDDGPDMPANGGASGPSEPTPAQ